MWYYQVPGNTYEWVGGSAVCVSPRFEDTHNLNSTILTVVVVLIMI